MFNHLLSVKRGREELKITTFSAYGDALDNTPDLELPDPKGASIRLYKEVATLAVG